MLYIYVEATLTFNVMTLFEGYCIEGLAMPDWSSCMVFNRLATPAHFTKMTKVKLYKKHLLLALWMGVAFTV